MKRIENNHFQTLNDYVYKIQLTIGATAAATYIIKDNVIVNEGYITEWLTTSSLYF
ncbi:hypothetical protein MHB73_01125 [Bacillus sp. FSL K6-6483]